MLFIHDALTYSFDLTTIPLFQIRGIRQRLVAPSGWRSSRLRNGRPIEQQPRTDHGRFRLLGLSAGLTSSGIGDQLGTCRESVSDPRDSALLTESFRHASRGARGVSAREGDPVPKMPFMTSSIAWKLQSRFSRKQLNIDLARFFERWLHFWRHISDFLVSGYWDC